MRKIEDRLKFLGVILTQPKVDEKLNHYHRQLLIEEVEHLELELKALPILTDPPVMEDEYA